jgi:class 3 adenylate cyclase/tetratricopeptide (TPR) repeat protein
MQSISEWLQSLGLDQYATVFTDNDIDLELIPSLSDQDLEKLGISSMGHRKKLLKAISELNDAMLATASPTETAPGFANDIVGEASATSPVSEGERRQLTVLFCDMVGFTELTSRFDPELLQAIIRSYEDICAAAITRYEGYVFQRLGDGIVAFFGYPLAHEGEAERAVRAGLQIIAALATREISGVGHLQVRIGVATGLVVVAPEGKSAVGETMNLAARLEAVAKPGSIVVSERVRRLAGGAFDYEDLGELSLKGIAHPTHAYGIVGVSEAASRFEAATHEGLTRLVGRELEIGLLMERWQLAQDGEGQVVLLSGEPGIGKSRMLSRLWERLDKVGAQAMRFQCSPYYVNSAFYPLIDNFERALKFQREESPEARLDKVEAFMVGNNGRPLDDVRFVASMLSVPCEERYGAQPMTPHKHKDETLRTLVDFVEAGARRQPSVILFEDLHWADPTTLDVLDLLIDRVRSFPLLVVLTHRPEFPSRWSQHGHVTALNLAKLTRAQSRTLVSGIARDKTLPADLLKRIIGKTDGVPLYVEELTRAVLESGQLRDMGDRYEYAGEVESITIPATLRDSLMARLDRVMPVKEVAQIGASIGREFSYELISAIAPIEQPELDDALARLTDSGLAYRRGTPPDATYTFKHALVQDAAYDSLLKSRRQQLHGKIARVIEQRFPHIKDTEPEVLAHHYTQMGLANKAIPYWLQAGQRGLEKLALPEAISHLNRALAILPDLESSGQRDTWEVEARVGLGYAHLALDGWGATQIEAMVRPALALSEGVERRDQWLAGCYVLGEHYLATLRFDDAREIAAKSLADGEKFGLDGHVLIGHGLLQWLEGTAANFEVANQHAAAFNKTYVPERHQKVMLLNDMQAMVNGWSAHHLWIAGWPEQAEQAMKNGIGYARANGNPLSLIISLAHGGAAFIYKREGATLLEHTNEASQVAKDNALGFLEGVVISIWRGSAMMLNGRFSEGHEMMTAATKLSLEANCPIMIPCHRLMAAEALAGLGRIGEAISILDGELVTIAKTGERIHEAEILRLRGVLTLRDDSSQTKSAEEFLQCAIDVSRTQKARGWELRTSTSLARLWKDQGKKKEAHDLLAPVYDWFTEGFGTKDLKEAKALLEELAT